jgi:hypothetical protein
MKAPMMKANKLRRKKRGFGFKRNNSAMFVITGYLLNRKIEENLCCQNLPFSVKTQQNCDEKRVESDETLYFQEEQFLTRKFQNFEFYVEF